MSIDLGYFNNLLYLFCDYN